MGNITFPISNLQQSLSYALHNMDTKLEGRSPTGLIMATTGAIIALSIFKNYYCRGWGKSLREKVGDLALRISYVNKKYAKDIQKEFVHFQESVRKKWESFRPLSTAIPDQGLSEEKLLQLIENYSKSTLEKLKDKHLSGTVYSKSLDNG